MPHEVECVDDQVPKPTYFVIAVLLCFQNLHIRDRSSFSRELRYHTNLLRSRENIPCEFRVGMDLNSCQFRVENNFGIHNDNWLTSAIVLPICTNFSRNPMTVPKLSDDVAEEICCITVPAELIPDGVDMCEFSAAS